MRPVTRAHTHSDGRSSEACCFDVALLCADSGRTQRKHWAHIVHTDETWYSCSQQSTGTTRTLTDSLTAHTNKHNTLCFPGVTWAFLRWMLKSNIQSVQDIMIIFLQLYCILSTDGKNYEVIETECSTIIVNSGLCLGPIYSLFLQQSNIYIYSYPLLFFTFFVAALW